MFHFDIVYFDPRFKLTSTEKPGIKQFHISAQLENNSHVNNNPYC